jgi:hypothetical protein
MTIAVVMGFPHEDRGGRPWLAAGRFQENGRIASVVEPGAASLNRRIVLRHG